MRRSKVVEFSMIGFPVHHVNTLDMTSRGVSFSGRRSGAGTIIAQHPQTVRNEAVILHRQRGGPIICSWRR